MLLANRIPKYISKVLTNKYKFSTQNITNISKKCKIESLTHNICNQIMIKYQFATNTKLTKQQIEQSSYEELVNKITNLYNYKQYKIPSSLALLQLHHQYKIFKAGDWVLDIGAGPHWSWTELALKLTRTPDSSHKVISNDLKQAIGERNNNVVVVGNFLDEPIRTKIAMQLLNRQLDVILIDATPQYSGNQQADANYTLDVFVKVLQFAQNYLKKGGTIVFKTVQSTLSLQNQNQSKIFFNQVYRYKPQNFRVTSPAFFYVLKGYMMNDNVKGIQNLLKQYKKAKNNYGKIKVIQKYRKLYTWDPIMMIVNEAQQNIIQMRSQGKKNQEIVKIYEDDPYVKVVQILESLSILQDKKSHVVDKVIASSKLLTGKSEEGLDRIPKNQEQFAQTLFKYVDEIQKSQKQQENKRQQKQNQKKGRSKHKAQNIAKLQSKAPLGQNQIYMKSTAVNQTKNRQTQKQVQENNYRPQDLYGYNPENPQQSIHRKAKKTQKQQREEQKIQLFKLSQSFPQLKQALQKNNNDFNELLKQKQKQFVSKFKDMEGFSVPKDQDQQIEDQQQVVGKTKKKSKSKIKQQQQQSFEQMLINKQKSKKQPKYQWQNLTQQQQMFPGSIKSKLNRLSKQNEKRQSKMSQQSDFDQMREQQKRVDQQELRNLAEEELDKVNKMEYLKTKPSKANRPVNYKKNRKQGGGPLNYFKNKDKRRQ